MISLDLNKPHYRQDIPSYTSFQAKLVLNASQSLKISTPAGLNYETLAQQSQMLMQETAQKV